MIESLLSFFAVDCQHSGFLDFPYWYSYLPDVKNGNTCSPQLQNLSDIWLIVMAVIEILLRIAAIMAVIFVIYSGISYVTSQGDPEATGRAKGALVNSLIGLAISVMAAAAVTFIAGSFN
ncbi:MAG TPA: hypothetical protein VHC21_00795 [Candidatus Saccharimonadales bacterium]|nr:hypothetical protein [Candidatus Saccharimonadales bacterium]